MNGQFRNFTSLVLCLLTLVSGCKPIQPYFFQEDGKHGGPGDLSHYMDIATDIEYPDVESCSLDEVHAAQAPLTVANSEDFDVWDLTLEEVTRITLTNSNVIRQLGGRITDNGSNISQVNPVTLQTNAGGTATTYDPSLVETGNGTGTGNQFSGTGVESALSQFDAILDSSMTFQKNDRPQNFNTNIGGIPNFFANQFRQDTSNLTLGITKTAANGSTFEIRNNTLSDFNNNGSRATPGDWFTNIEAAVTQPLLQGAGTQINRIQGPQSFQQAAGGVVNQIDGVIISRIRHDISLADFEAGVRDLMRDVEDAYWELYFTYRDLEARKVGRDSALATWQKVKALERVGGTGGEADKEAQARSQYFLFRSQVETAFTTMLRVEANLRYLMGLSASDGRLIRPIDEPSTAKVQFDWPLIHAETLARRSELRRQKWQVKRRELELIATRNNLLPRLDAVGRYRWLGAGEDLISSTPTGVLPFADGSNAWESLTRGRYQEWEAGIQFSMPIGFRNALSGVRHHQLLLARERAVLQDLELEISHNLNGSVRDLDLNYGLTQTNFNRRVAAVDEVEAVEAVYDSGRVTLDLLLEAQRRRSEAESAYYRSLVDYNRAIMRVHYSKGSLLEYNGVYLAEGPWPGKAQFDALRRARQRDASTYLDYGFTRPNVISRGAYEQIQGNPNYDSTPLQPTPASPGPQEATPLEGTPIDGEPLEQEIIPPPPGAPEASKVIQQTSYLEPVDSTGHLTNLPTTLPTVAESTVVGLPSVSQAHSPTGTPAMPIELPITEPQTLASTSQTSLHSNPYRQGKKVGTESPPERVPVEAVGINPLRPTLNTHFSTAWSADPTTPIQAAPATTPESTAWPKTQR